MPPWQHIMSGAGWVHLYAIYVTKLCCFVKPSQWHTHVPTVDVARGRMRMRTEAHTLMCSTSTRTHTCARICCANALNGHLPGGRPVCPHVQAQTSLAVLLSYSSSALSDEHCMGCLFVVKTVYACEGCRRFKQGVAFAVTLGAHSIMAAVLWRFSCCQQSSS